MCVADSTMPLDVIKTRMQSIHAKQEYRNLVHCGWRIFKEEGALTLWKGAVPRLARLSVRRPLSFPFSPPLHFLPSQALSCWKRGLTRLVLFLWDQMSGGIVFYVYETVISVISPRQ